MSARIAIIVGTRPEVIKMAPVARALWVRGHRPDVIAFGQHVELLAAHLTEEKLAPRRLCEMNRAAPGLNSVAGEALHCGDVYLDPKRYGLVLVQGDTTTAAMAALAAFHNGIPVGHVEAGLRTGNLGRPFPEEANRRIIAQVATLHFAPTREAYENLIEGAIVSDQTLIAVTGNTIVDALYAALKRRPAKTTRDMLHQHASSKSPYMLITCHRRESWQTYVPALAQALKAIPTRVIWPVHPNPEIRKAVRKNYWKAAILGAINPLPHVDFVHLLKHAALVITDSGGVTEEAAILGKRTIILRGETERPEALARGAIMAQPGQIEDRIRYALRLRLLRPTRAFGDGHAGERIARICLTFLRS